MSILNPSSLLDLKAELHKKYETFRSAKLVQKSDSSKRTTLKRKNEPVKDKKTVTPDVIKLEENSEEELALKKSRLALEAKAKIYENITSNKVLIDDEENERYLVDFQRKVLYDSPPVTDNSKNERKGDESSCSEDDTVFDHLKEARTTESKRPMPSFQCNQEVEENKSSDGPVHYQNIQFNEVRDHGAGYFAFSMDESKRKEQMDHLNSLRQETEQQRLAARKIHKKRKEMLQARLAKVCERRNIDKSAVISHTTTTTQDTEDLSEEQNVELSSIPLPEAPTDTEKKEVKVRPWDIGKTNYPFIPERNSIKSQNIWVAERRSERPSEFAPPSSYR